LKTPSAAGGASRTPERLDEREWRQRLNSGEIWSGRGRMASWLKKKQDAGEEIEKYRV